MQILKLNWENFKEIVKITTQSIKEGKVIICPTDTVYGLICDATNKKAVNKIFKIKKRPKNKPLPIFVKDLKTAKKLALINKNQGKFFKKAWPGKITVVLKRKEGKQIYGIDKKTIALRVPNYKLVNILLKKLKYPLIGTSANISGKPPLTKIKEVLKQFTLRRGSGQKKYQPDLVIDAGNLPKSRPSLVIDLTKEPPKILRT
jgi:L-threonylcarbamoyladenylate synthase